MVPVAPIITGITIVFTFHVRWISIVRSLYFKMFSASFLITLLSLEMATSISMHVLFSLSLLLLLLLFYGLAVITYSSVSRAAPSNVFSSIPVTLFLLRSSFCRFSSLPNKPSDFMRPISLSFSKLKQKQKAQPFKLNAASSIHHSVITESHWGMFYDN